MDIFFSLDNGVNLILNVNEQGFVLWTTKNNAGEVRDQWVIDASCLKDGFFTAETDENEIYNEIKLKSLTKTTYINPISKTIPDLIRKSFKSNTRVNGMGI